MKTPELLQVLQGRTDRITAPYPTPALAKQARARAYALMYQVRIRHAIEATARIYIDPEDPCVLVCDREAQPAFTKYSPVLSLREGDDCVLDLGDTLPASVKARLKTMAAEVQAELGSRPCWVAEPVRSQLGLYRITRLPDGYNPATGAPRARTDDQKQQVREDEDRRDWAHMTALQDAYEEQVMLASTAGLPVPPVPEELRRLVSRLFPEELVYLEEISKGGHAMPKHQETAPC